MSVKQKYLLVVLAGWIVPITCILAGKGAVAVALAAVTIAWWHGYIAGKLEPKALAEKSAS